MDKFCRIDGMLEQLTDKQLNEVKSVLLDEIKHCNAVYSGLTRVQKDYIISLIDIRLTNTNEV